MPTTHRCVGRADSRDVGGGPRASLLLGTFPGTFFIFPHSSSTCPIAPGDIEVFKGMELTSLVLSRCWNLTGVFGLGWGMVGGVKIGNRLRPQGITLTYQGLSRNLLHFSSHLLPPPLHPPGNIEVFEGMQIKELNLKYCQNLEGECMELGWWG